MAISTVKRDEFFQAIQNVTFNTQSAKEELFRTLEKSRDELMEVCKDTRDLVKAQNGKVYETVNKVSVLEERVTNLTLAQKDISMSMKDNPSRWMSGGALVGLLAELIRHLITTGKV